MGIRVENLVKQFRTAAGGANRVVDDVSFEVRPGELVALLGPSGGGKSTVLRIIAGLEQADGGEVWLDGRRVDAVHARERQVGFVFQHYALFRHMTVGENVAFGLRVQGASQKEQTDRVRHLLSLMGLGGLEDRLPAQLSGGQRQRVALARALAPAPKLLLLDEPFGAVDAKVREELRRWLRKLHDEVHTTSIFVTHDQEEAFAVSDRVMVIQNGRLEQAGSPVEILDHPATEFVARFVGEVNVLDGVMRAGSARCGPLALPVTDGPAAGGPDGAAVRVVVRAYDLKFWRDDEGVAVVVRVLPIGDRVRVEATLDGGLPLFAQFPRRSSLLTGVVPGSRTAIEVTHARAWPVPSLGTPSAAHP
jgi:sulfate transport system ATP-binding protein